MAYLIDTSILARLANSADAQYALSGAAIMELHRRGEVLNLTPQVLIEFRNVATRPVNVNGLGLSPLEAKAQSAGFEGTFAMLPDSPDVYPAWKALVEALDVIGKQVHDARLIAVCHAHRVSHLLTFNTAHFGRLTKFGPGLTIVSPANV